MRQGVGGFVSFLTYCLLERRKKILGSLDPNVTLGFTLLPKGARRMAQATYTVGQLARMSGTSVRTLHHYEDMGLLVPARRANGYRTYTSADAERLQQILLFRACGMELGQIRELLDAPGFSAREATKYLPVFPVFLVVISSYMLRNLFFVCWWISLIIPISYSFS